VDLNAMIYWNAKILAEFYHLLGNSSKAMEYEAKAEEWQVAVTEVLWHEETGVWLDYDILNEKKRDYFFPSNIAPLWTGCYDKANQEEIVTLVMKYLQKMQITVNIGGIPASQVHTNEQWDYPNAWPPLQHMMIIGLDNTGDSYAKKLASEMAQQWVRANYIGYEKNEAMFEKV
jgi:alpha,alpha-trehalase